MKSPFEMTDEEEEFLSVFEPDSRYFPMFNLDLRNLDTQPHLPETCSLSGDSSGQPVTKRTHSPLRIPDALLCHQVPLGRKK